MKSKLLLCIFVFLCHFGLPLQAALQRVAFPGAEGFGAYAKGGRGGVVLKVNTLEDTPNKGSLRWAVSQKGPRIVLFEVSGVIELQDDLIIKEPFLTLDASTAPGIGITLKDGTLKIANTHDIIIRYLRVRPGDEVALNKKPSRKSLPSDAIKISDSQRVIIDHCSASWCSAEALSVTGKSSNITVQNCFITETLSNPNLDSHPFGASISGGNISYIRNLFAYYTMGGPQVSCYGNKEMINNVCLFYEDSGTRFNIENIQSNSHLINCIYDDRLTNEAPEIFIFTSAEKPLTKLSYVNLYLSGNLGPERKETSQDEWAGVRNELNDTLATKLRASQPLFHSKSTILPTDQVLHHVLTNSGTTLPSRDFIDERIIQQILNHTGSLIYSPEEVGGYDLR